MKYDDEPIKLVERYDLQKTTTGFSSGLPQEAAVMDLNPRINMFRRLR